MIMSNEYKTPEKWRLHKKEYYKKNKDKIKRKSREYYKKIKENPEKMQKMKDYKRNYMREWQRKKLNIKPEKYKK